MFSLHFLHFDCKSLFHSTLVLTCSIIISVLYYTSLSIVNLKFNNLISIYYCGSSSSSRRVTHIHWEIKSGNTYLIARTNFTVTFLTCQP